jgi:hypothetical protein
MNPKTERFLSIPEEKAQKKKGQAIETIQLVWNRFAVTVAK